MVILQDLFILPDWDFRWQEIYRFKKLIKVPKGSVMHIEGTYDNTSENPANPILLQGIFFHLAICVQQMK